MAEFNIKASKDWHAGVSVESDKSSLGEKRAKELAKELAAEITAIEPELELKPVTAVENIVDGIS